MRQRALYPYVSQPALRNVNTQTFQPQKIGRFDILRVLGTGAQSVVYLGYDANLQREVAIKSLRLSGRDAAQKRMLMDEARTVSKLRHPNIVPIFDAGEQDGDPYLVFEYVEGRTLGELLREEGGLAPPLAVDVILQILDGIEHAHKHQVVHRDLKPSNILINGDGVPRVMDFGIAVRLSHEKTGTVEADGDDQMILGTPAYMAPECITDGHATPQSDVFAAGLILCELLTGMPVVRGKDPYAVLRRMSSEPIELPPEAAGSVDDILGGIILSATTMDCAVRYPDVAAMRAALQAWQKPVEDEAPLPSSSSENSQPSTLDFLLRRMRHKSDFPALSEAISTINRLASSDQESVATLSNTILKDVALTNKLIRLVNSAHYSQAGGGSISTISRAVMILGFGPVRTIATSLVLMEHMQNKTHAAQIRDEFVRAIMGGILARDMGRRGMVKDYEEAFVCSMFHNLGRMLACYYFPEEMAEVKKLQAQQNTAENIAATKILGISFEELGIGVAKSWGFPDQMVGSMRRLPVGHVKKPSCNADKLRVLAEVSDQLCTIFEKVPAEKRGEELRKITQRFGDSLPCDARQLAQVLESSLEEVVTYTSAIHLNLQQSPLGKQICAWATPAEPVADDSAAPGLGRTSKISCKAENINAIPGNLADTPTVVMAQPAGAAASADCAPAGLSPEDTQAILNAGIQEITRSLVEECALSGILRIIVETMYRGIGFQRVLLCIRDAKQNTMAAKFGFGPDIEEATRRFHFHLGETKDIFEVAVTRGADILISDINDPKIRSHIPAWFSKNLAAETFIIFPLMIKGAAVGMIYADKARANELVIPENVLSTLRALRNQAVLAIKQSR